MSLEDIANRICALANDRCNLLILTGGEPLIQQRSIVVLLDILRVCQPNLRCEIETNGTRDALRAR